MLHLNNCNEPLCRLLWSDVPLCHLLMERSVYQHAVTITLSVFIVFFSFQKRDFPAETFDGNKSELFRRCLCTGYFTNVARRYHQGSFKSIHI